MIAIPVPDRRPPQHGGDFAVLKRHFPDAPGPWIDLSTGINPWPYPLPALPAEAWTRLPARSAEDAVRAKAAAYYGFDDPARVVLAPGSQALLQWLPRLRPPSRVAVFGPTYAEHAWTWAAAGHAVETIAWDAEPAPGIDVAVVARPNNPDGRIFPLARLERLAGTLAARGGWLVVDEAFADVSDEPSVARTMPGPALVVLRSFGKFFGLAGCRLGFAWAMPPLCEALRRALGPWCVPGPALAIAAQALADARWIADTRARLATAAARLDRTVMEAGFDVVGGTSLFRLYASPTASAHFDALAAAGVLVRRFADAAHWLRFGLPGDAAVEQRLATALAAPVA